MPERFYHNPIYSVTLFNPLYIKMGGGFKKRFCGLDLIRTFIVQTVSNNDNFINNIIFHNGLNPVACFYYFTVVRTVLQRQRG